MTAEPTRPETFGAVDVRWDGEEGSTAWPAIAVRLLVTPEDDGRATRLILLSRRPPGAELITERLGRVHGRRIVEVATQRFPRELADIVSEPGPLHTQAASVTRFDRGSTYVHHARQTPTDSDELADRLTRDATAVAETVTAAAVDAAAPVLVAGGFRAPAKVHERRQATGLRRLPSSSTSRRAKCWTELADCAAPVPRPEPHPAGRRTPDPVVAGTVCRSAPAGAHLARARLDQGAPTITWSRW